MDCITLIQYLVVFFSPLRNCFQDDDFMERQAAKFCRFACQHGQTDHEKVQKRAVPQVRNRRSKEHVSFSEGKWSQNCLSSCGVDQFCERFYA